MVGAVSHEEPCGFPKSARTPARFPSVPDVRDDLIDLDARAGWATVLRPVGFLLLTAFGLVCVADLVIGREAWPVRLVAGAFGVLILLGLLGYWLTRDKRPRWLGIDYAGVRLVNGSGRDIHRFRWEELAGVGLMTDEAARRRHRFAATVRRTPPALVSVSVWLELYPASPEVVQQHPELRGSWSLGAPRRPGQQQRWLFQIGRGFAVQTPPVGERVQRWRPELWRGHRAASVLFG